MKRLILIPIIYLALLMTSCVVVPAGHHSYAPYDDDDDLPILLHRGHHSPYSGYHSYHDHDRHGHDRDDWR